MIIHVIMHKTWMLIQPVGQLWVAQARTHQWAVLDIYQITLYVVDSHSAVRGSGLDGPLDGHLSLAVLACDSFRLHCSCMLAMLWHGCVLYSCLPPMKMPWHNHRKWECVPGGKCLQE